MGTVERSARIGVMAVCLDATSYEALSHFLAGIPGAVIFGNPDHYVGVEREIGRALDLSQTRICFIDYDRNTEEAIWMTERLRSEYPDVQSFAVSAYSEPEAIIAAMRAGCAEYLLKPVQHDRVLDGLARVAATQSAWTKSCFAAFCCTIILGWISSIHPRPWMRFTVRRHQVWNIRSPSSPTLISSSSSLARPD